MVIGEEFNIYATENSLVESIPVWVQKTDGNGYDLGEEVLYGDRIYKSLKVDNIDLTSNKLLWSDTRPSNTVAWDDQFPSTFSSSTEDIVLKFEHVNDTSFVYFANLVGESIEVKITEGTDVVLETSISLVDYDEPQDAWQMEYQWGDKTQLGEYLLSLQQMYTDATIEIRIRKSSNYTQVGFLKIGVKKQFGCTISEVSIQKNPIQDFITLDDKRYVVGGRGWIEESFKLYFDNTYNFKKVLKDTNKLGIKSNLFIGDDTGENQEYSISGLLPSYSADPVNRTLSFSVYSIDTYY